LIDTKTRADWSAKTLSVSVGFLRRLEIPSAENSTGERVASEITAQFALGWRH
jgi:hypothetical protein